MTEPILEHRSAGSRNHGVSAQLREQTSEHHQRAERSEFQQRFVRGKLPVSAYVAWLEQMLCVYQVLESQLSSGASTAAGLDVEPWRRTEHLTRDLTYLRAADPVLPVNATRAFLQQLGHWAQSQPLALLGVLYVLEGSTNGSRFIAKSLRKAYNLGDAGGLAFMDPYGASQPERWRTFKAELDRAIPAAAAAGLIDTAKKTFDAVSAIGEELLPLKG